MSEHRGYISVADEKGSVNTNYNVVAVIAASAAIEVDGVHALYQSASRELTEVSGRKGISRGIRLEVDDDNVVVDVYLIAKVGFAVNEVGEAVQRVVKAAIEEAVGVNVSAVNVNICGISLKQKSKATDSPDTASE